MTATESSPDGDLTPSMVTVQQAPGRWSSQVDVACAACGWRERVDLGDASHRYAERLATRHEDECAKGRAS